MQSLNKYIKLLTVAGITTFVGLSVFVGSVVASSTSNFNQVINPGTLLVDIVDGAYASVVNPAVTFPAYTFNFACSSSVATFGTVTETIYVQNPDAADNGWVVSFAATGSPTATWTGTSGSYDFNDVTNSGCDDGGDTDTVAGRMTVDPSTATINVGNCASCTTTGVTAGSSAAFNEGVLDSVTILNASAGSNDIADFVMTGITITQTIPAEQPAGNDYEIDMTLSILAS